MEEMGVENESGDEGKKWVKFTVRIGAIVIGSRHVHATRSLFPTLESQDGGTGEKIEVDPDRLKEAPSSAPDHCGGGVKRARVKFVEGVVKYGVGKKIRLIEKPPSLYQEDTTPCSTHHMGDDHGVSFESEKKTSLRDELLTEVEQYLLPECNTNTKVVVTTEVNSKKTPPSHARILKKLRSMGTKNKKRLQAARMNSTRCSY